MIRLSALGKPANVLLILSDDHRYDFMSLWRKPLNSSRPRTSTGLPRGAHLANASSALRFVPPAGLPLTGQYMRNHRVVDNQRPVPPGTRFFPEYLREAGYRTGYVGKWHMGHEDDTPRKGFDHWVSFAGQGTYFDPTFNINGKRKDFKGYNADLLTDQAISWLKEVGPASKKGKPFFLQVGYKAVHYPFQPPPAMPSATKARRSITRKPWPTPKRLPLPVPLDPGKKIRIHGIDHMETGALDKDPVPSFDELYHNFCETVHALDENIERYSINSTNSESRRIPLSFILETTGLLLANTGSTTSGMLRNRSAYPCSPVIRN